MAANLFLNIALLAFERSGVFGVIGVLVVAYRGENWFFCTI